MGIEFKIKKNMKAIPRKFFKCAHCGSFIEIKIDYKLVEQSKEKGQFIIPHFHLHGNPLHGTLCHLDLNGDIRNIDIIENISVAKEPNILYQILDKLQN